MQNNLQWEISDYIKNRKERKIELTFLFVDERKQSEKICDNLFVTYMQQVGHHP